MSPTSAQAHTQTGGQRVGGPDYPHRDEFRAADPPRTAHPGSVESPQHLFKPNKSLEPTEIGFNAVLSIFSTAGNCKTPKARSHRTAGKRHLLLNAVKQTCQQFGHCNDDITFNIELKVQETVWPHRSVIQQQIAGLHRGTEPSDLLDRRIFLECWRRLLTSTSPPANGSVVL